METNKGQHRDIGYVFLWRIDGGRLRVTAQLVKDGEPFFTIEDEAPSLAARKALCEISPSQWWKCASTRKLPSPSQASTQPGGSSSPTYRKERKAQLQPPRQAAITPRVPNWDNTLQRKAPHLAGLIVMKAGTSQAYQPAIASASVARMSSMLLKNVCGSPLAAMKPMPAQNLPASSSKALTTTARMPA